MNFRRKIFSTLMRLFARLKDVKDAGNAILLEPFLNWTWTIFGYRLLIRYTFIYFMRNWPRWSYKWLNFSFFLSFSMVMALILCYACNECPNARTFFSSCIFSFEFDDFPALLAIFLPHNDTIVYVKASELITHVSNAQETIFVKIPIAKNWHDVLRMKGIPL